MKNLILTLAILMSSLMVFSQQEKGTTQVSALNVSAEGATINISSPSITYYCYENIGFSLGIANIEDITIGARYYVEGNNFVAASYGTSSESVDLGVGKTYNWGDHVQIEPRLTFSNILDDARDLGLAIHLNLVF